LAAERYLDKHPDRAVRWGYSPQNKSAQSKIPLHMAAGYRPVPAEELGEDLSDFYGGAGSEVRVVDSVLMEMPAELKQEREDILRDDALEEANLAQTAYYDAMAAEEQRAAGKGIKPVGEIKYHSTTHAVSIPEIREGGEK